MLGGEEADGMGRREISLLNGCCGNERRSAWKGLSVERQDSFTGFDAAADETPGGGPQ